MKSILIFLFSFTVFAVSPVYEYATLNNGIKVVFVKVEENPVISSTVVVKVGLKHESKEINGISHLLEHLMFNGTKKRSQKQLYRDFDAIGCYNNASTSDHYTAYYVLSSKENFEKALEIQSDMLFNSTLPENKIPKEKGIVVEEIRKDKMSPSFYEEKAFRKAVFGGTPYSMKVIGTEKSVKSLKRDEILKFYKTYYSPKNMVILIAGDYDKKKILSYLDRYFGNQRVVELPKKNWEIKWDKPYIEVDENNLPYSVFYYVVKGVKADSPLFPAQEGYVELLNKGLKKDLMEIDPHFSVSSDYTDDYGLIKIRVKVKNKKESETVKAVVDKKLSENLFITKDNVKELKISFKADTLFALERPHFFGMLQAPFLAAGCDNPVFYDEINFASLKKYADNVKRFDKVSVFIKGGKNEKN